MRTKLEIERKAKKASGRSARKARTMRQMLDQIDTFLADKNVDSAEQSKLWDVLSALRGPDERLRIGGAVKSATIAVIRTAAFPKTELSASGAKNRASFAYPQRKIVFSDDFKDFSYHFRSHTRKAAEALGLVKPSDELDY